MSLNDLQRACTGPVLAVGRPLRGWREWSVTPAGLRGARGRLWEPGVNTAECHGRYAVMFRVLGEMLGSAGVAAPGHTVEPWCTCGLYSWRHPDPVGHRSGRVAGVVELWGRVLIGEHGYRAQYAKVVAISGPRRAVADSFRSAGREAAERYGVPYLDTLDHAIEAIEQLDSEGR